MADDLQQWFRNVPLVTKFFLVGTLSLTFALSFEWVGAQRVVFISELIRNKFHVWRLVTPFLFAGKFSFNFAMHLLVLYENCRRYEVNPFNTGAGGNSADFLYMILLGGGVMLVLAHIFDFFVLSEPLLFYIMYVWSRRDPDTQLNIYGFRFKGLYLPWIYSAIRLVMGQDIVLPLVGIAVGHAYYFFITIVPAQYGIDWIKTPQFCVQIANWYSGVSGAPARAVAARAGAPIGPAPGNGGGIPAPGNVGSRGAGYRWGRGNVLGGN